MDLSAALARPAPPAPPPGGGGAADGEAYADVLHRHIAKLERLSDIAMQVAEAVGEDIRRALAPPSGDEAEAAARAADDRAEAARPARDPRDRDLALQFARVSRAVRLTIALQARLIGELRCGAAGPRAAAAAAEADDPAEARRAALEAIVAQVAEAEHPGAREAVERLVGEARERLREDDRFGGLLDRPIGEIIAGLCRDLGLSPDWPRLADEAWTARLAAEAEARAALAQGGGKLVKVVFVDPPAVPSRTGPSGDPPNGLCDDDIAPGFASAGPPAPRPPPWPPEPPPDLGLPGELPPPRRPRW